MKKAIILLGILTVLVLMAGWNWFDGLQGHSGADETYSVSPDWGQRATGLWAVQLDSSQVSSPLWTQRATGSWAFVTEKVLAGPR